MKYNYAGLGIKYLFMPGKNMWLSWEAGLMAIQENSISLSGNNRFEVTNNKLVEKKSSMMDNGKVLNNNLVNPYFKIQYSFSLFSIGDRSKYPDRKKVALGLGVGITQLNTDINTVSHQLLLINSKQNIITKTTIIRPSNTLYNLNAGRYFYL